MKLNLTIPLKTLVNGALITAFVMTTNLYASGNLNVYSARKEALIKPALDAFAKKYRVNVNLITANADVLLNRLINEGDASPADIFITVDAGRLFRAKEAGVLKPVETDYLTKTVPAHLRDKDNYWYGLSQRARVIFYNPKRINKFDFSTYEDLANPKWKGKICTRSSSNIYNQSLVASMIATQGKENTLNWIKGFVDNLARPPFGGDTDLLHAVAAGVCDLTIANTYYFGRMGQSNNKTDQKTYQSLALFWPNQGVDERGAHVNVSGIGMTNSAKNTRNARRLMQFLTSEDSQKWYADVNNEYPVKVGIPAPRNLQVFGTFKADTLSLSALGENNRLAVELMDQGGWK
ncbi:Fe(3+) ABC transporter substrate-binding protein [Marinomonas sp. TI.3.20]|uniref:Fe(3+) ABC transporter substrate-binding protein n=1 Tax=Marinomonas sp. TI.3.20 TaxID=3121296 RepID=UPI00311F0A71